MVKAGSNVFALNDVKNASCDTHGEFVSKKLFGNSWTKCPSCESERALREADEAERKNRLSRRSDLERKIGEACIPERFRDRSFETFEAVTEQQQFALKFAMDYAENFDEVLRTGRGALLIGNPGTGKTHLAIAIARQIMERDGRTALFTTTLRMLRRVKDTWHRDSSESQGKAVSLFVAPDLLILDEVGIQFGSDAELIILFDILNERYEKRRPTIYLANLDRDGVQKFLGDRIVSRLREDVAEVVVFDWEDHRGRAVS